MFGDGFFMALTKKETRIAIALVILICMLPLGFFLSHWAPYPVFGIIFALGFWILAEIIGANTEGIFRRPKDDETKK